MIRFLDENEFVEAGDGFIGEPTKTKTPGFNLHTAEDRELHQCVCETGMSPSTHASMNRNV